MGPKKVQRDLETKNFESHWLRIYPILYETHKCLKFKIILKKIVEHANLKTLWRRLERSKETTYRKKKLLYSEDLSSDIDYTALLDTSE